MKDVTDKSFGVVIAFLLPGFLFLWGLSFSNESVATWLVMASQDKAPTVGGFLFTTVASLSVGLLLSAVRWLLIDSLLRRIGVGDPGLNFGRLNASETYTAFASVVENHYRYYQYYSNTLVAIVGAFVAYLVCEDWKVTCALWILFLFIAIALFMGSKDSLKKYYDRANEILSWEKSESVK